MSRTVPEWIGKSDDEKIPPRVKARIAARSNDCCQNCGIRVRYGGEVDHAVALILGGPHRESNLRFLCSNCHAAKTKTDVALKSRAAQTKKRMGSVRRDEPKMKLSKRFDGTITRWNPETRRFEPIGERQP
jgi:5-methylcytosine-specific restriction enzyme A